MSARSVRPLLLWIVIVFAAAACQMTGQPGSSSSWLPPETSAQVNFPLAAAAQVFTFDTNPAAPTILTLFSSTAELDYTAEVRSSTGDMVAMLEGDGLQTAVLTIAPTTGLYEITLKSENGGIPGSLSLGVSAAAASKSVEQPPINPTASCTLSSPNVVNVHTNHGVDYSVLGLLPANTTLPVDLQTDDGWFRVLVNNQYGWIGGLGLQLSSGCAALPRQSVAQPVNISQNNLPLSAACQVISSLAPGGNVRGGPGIEYSIVGALPVGSSLPATGQSRGWYQVDRNGSSGWISGSVVTPNGECVNLPAVQVTPPIAPLDTDSHSITMPQNSAASLIETISYPDGDRYDYVRINLPDLNTPTAAAYRELIVRLDCAGAGKEMLRWGTPDHMAFTCDTAILLPFADGESQQMIAVALPEGIAQSYVQYTLQVTPNTGA